MEMLFKHITEVQKLTLTKNDILVVKLDRDKMPPSVFDKYTKRVHEMFKRSDPDMTVWVVPSTMEFAILNKEEVKNLEEKL